MKKEKDWGCGSVGRVLACLAFVKPWIQSPVPQKPGSGRSLKFKFTLGTY